MSRGLRWRPFLNAKKHTIPSEWLVCLDQRGTIRRCTFENERFLDLNGAVIENVSVWHNDESVWKAIGAVEQELEAMRKRI